MTAPRIMYEPIEKLRQQVINRNPLADPEWIVKKNTHAAYLREGFMYINRNLSIDEFRMAPEGASAINYLLKNSINLVVNDLLSQAKNKPTDSWRKTKNAIAYTYACLGALKTAKKIKMLKNPVKPEDRKGKTGRQSRRKEVSDDEFKLLLENRVGDEDYDAATLLILCRCLGIRPSDATSVQYREINANEILVMVPPGKKTGRGELNDRQQRGLWRELILPANKALESAILHWGPCDGEKTKNSYDIKRATGRIMYAADKLIPPKRGQHFVMYSLRYNMGAELKAAYLDDPEGAKILAAVLGQRSTSSTSPYGNKRSARGSRAIALPKPTQKTVDAVRDDQKLGVRPATMRRAQNNPRRRLPSSATAKRDAVRKPSRLDVKVSSKFTTSDLGHDRSRK